MNTSASTHQTSLLAKNTIFNLFGYGAPLIVALFALPKIITELGNDRFGILSLAWVLIGYLGLLDLGLGRALTKVISEKLSQKYYDDIPPTIWTGLCVMVAVSLLIAFIFGFFSHWLVYDILKIPFDLKQETQRSFILLSMFIPIVILSVGLRGILEAYQRFDIVNAIRIPHGIFSFIAPLLVIPITPNLVWVIGVILTGRLFFTLIQFLFCIRIIPDLVSGISFDFSLFRKLLGFGSWMTVTNVVSPAIVYLDRFFIGTFLSISSVTFYSTPSEVLTKLTLISAALMSVLFPAISESYQTDRQKSASLLENGMKYVFIIIFPIVMLLITFAPEGIRLWLNDEFLTNSLTVCRVLTIGVFFACIGQIPYAFIQGGGRPDLTGKLHLIELPIYLLVLMAAISIAGITGAAVVWTLRAIIETIFMYLISQKMLSEYRLHSISKAIVLIIASLNLLLFMFMESLSGRIVSFILCLFVWFLVSSKLFFSKNEKRYFLKFFQAILKR